jgi:L-ascorbate metabolism protein UlaG (beta-lactamase superfamily)
MIEPFLKDEKFLDDVEASNLHDGNYRVWWLGQSGFLLQWNGHHALLDPYLSDSLTRKYANTDKPHVRMTGRVIDPFLLNFIEVVTSSHTHTDHLDPETLGPLMLANPALKLVAPEANREVIANRLNVDVSFLVGISDGQSVDVGEFNFTAVPAAHDEVSANCMGFIIKFGIWTVYHSGDTRLYPGMAERLRPFNIDLALLPINGALPERRVAGNLDAREAARLAKDIGARCVIPCHYGMFTFNTADPAEFEAAAKALGQPYAILRTGERWP